MPDVSSYDSGYGRGCAARSDEVHGGAVKPAMADMIGHHCYGFAWFQVRKAGRSGLGSAEHDVVALNFELHHDTNRACAQRSISEGSRRL